MKELILIPLLIGPTCEKQAQVVVTTCLERVEPREFEFCFKVAEKVLENCKYQKAKR